MERKTCCICGAPFVPHRKVSERQKTCGKPDCRLRQKQHASARWREHNPDYTRNDYSRVKAWLDQHPGYLKRFREEHPDYVQRNRDAQRKRDRRRRRRLDIRDKLMRQPSEIMEHMALPVPSSHLDIQDETTLEPLEITLVLSRLARLPCLDIQAEMDLPFCRSEHGTIPSGGGNHGCTMAHRS